MGTPTWFVSHAHMDHIVNLPVYVARRRMMKMDPPVIYLPESTIEPVRKILKLYSKLDRGRLPCELLPARPGDEIELSRELVVTVSATVHTVPSLGFVVWQRRRKLKPEFQGLAGEEIRDLRLGGTEVTAEVRVPRLAYLGDSAPAGLDACEAMYQAEVLIMEMTFVAPSHRKDKIHKFGHMHLDDFLERIDRFRNERVLATHFSTRYHSHQVRQHVERRGARHARRQAAPLALNTKARRARRRKGRRKMEDRDEAAGNRTGKKYGESTTPEMERIAREIVDAAFKVHTALGTGLLESVYETCLEYELLKRGLRVERQKKVTIRYDDVELDNALRLDLLVEGLVLVEVKAVETMHPVFTAQTLTYLKLTDRRLAFLINFNVVRIKDGIKRLIR